VYVRTSLDRTALLGPFGYILLGLFHVVSRNVPSALIVVALFVCQGTNSLSPGFVLVRWILFRSGIMVTNHHGSHKFSSNLPKMPSNTCQHFGLMSLVLCGIQCIVVFSYLLTSQEVLWKQA
jgi:hypothetical protein